MASHLASSGVEVTDLARVKSASISIHTHTYGRSGRKECDKLMDRERGIYVKCGGERGSLVQVLWCDLCVEVKCTTGGSASSN